MAETVLVTGANGHVGYMLARLLAERGYRVRAGVRDPDDPARTAHLAALDVDVVRAELMEPATLDAALKGCDGLFQVAAVYRTWARDPQREIIDPSVIGGLNALRAAHAAGVRRVVFTSSTAAVGKGGGGVPLTEAVWNDGARHPYALAKTVAERRAWAFAEESGLDLVVVNPSAVIGPCFHRHTPTTGIFDMVRRGKLRFAPPAHFGYVDVRDVALGHLLAYENPQASGRYILSTANLSAREMLDTLQRIDPTLRVPQRSAPLWLVRVAARWEAFLSLFGRTPAFTPAMVREYMGSKFAYSAEKARRELGWEPRDIEQSFRDTLAWMREQGL